MDARLRRALLSAPLAAVAAVAVVALVIALLLTLLIGESWVAVYTVLISAVFLVIFGIPTAYLVTGTLVGLALVTRTSLAEVSYRTVAGAALVGTLLATLGLIWSADNLEEWWMSLFTLPGALAGARTFVRLRGQAKDALPAS